MAQNLVINGVTYNGVASLEIPKSGGGKAEFVDASSVIVPNCKQFSFSNSTAVAAKYTTVVSGDPDVAAHYADANAMVTIHKITNTDQNGIAWACSGNILNGTNYGVYYVFNASTGASSQAQIPKPISEQTDQAAGNIHVMCTSAGDIRILCNRLQANFGGASYKITFAW